MSGYLQAECADVRRNHWLLGVHFQAMISFDLETAIDCLKRMEETVLGLKQVRSLLPDTPAREMLDALIVEAEQHIAEVKPKVIQWVLLSGVAVCKRFPWRRRRK